MRSSCETFKIIRDTHHDHAIVQGFGLLIGEELVKLRLIGVGDDALVGIDQREATGLDVFLLRQRQEHIEKALIRLEHFDKFHQAAVGDIELAIEAVGARVGFGAIIADGGEIDAANQFRMSWDFGSDGTKVPMPQRSFSEKKMRRTGT